MNVEPMRKSMTSVKGNTAVAYKAPRASSVLYLISSKQRFLGKPLLTLEKR